MNQPAAQPQPSSTAVTLYLLERLSAMLPSIPFNPAWRDSDGSWQPLLENREQFAEIYAYPAEKIYMTVDGDGRRAFLFLYEDCMNVIYQPDAIPRIVRPGSMHEVTLKAVCGSLNVRNNLLEGNTERLGIVELGSVFAFLGPPEAELIVLAELEDRRSDDELQHTHPKLFNQLTRLRRLTQGHDMSTGNSDSFDSPAAEPKVEASTPVASSPIDAVYRKGYKDGVISGFLHGGFLVITGVALGAGIVNLLRR